MNTILGHLQIPQIFTKKFWPDIWTTTVTEERIMDNRRLLKVKLKTLTAEAKIIRNEECKTNGVIRSNLHKHRVKIVRYEARHTHLAYGYIKGRTYQQIEQNSHTQPNWQKVKRMVTKYGQLGIRFNSDWHAPI